MCGLETLSEMRSISSKSLDVDSRVRNWLSTIRDNSTVTVSDADEIKYADASDVTPFEASVSLSASLKNGKRKRR